MFGGDRVLHKSGGLLAHQNPDESGFCIFLLTFVQSRRSSLRWPQLKDGPLGDLAAGRGQAAANSQNQPFLP